MATDDAGRRRSAAGSDAGAEEQRDRARAVGSHRPGLVEKVVDRGRTTVEGIRLPRADWRTFAWGLLLLIAAIFVIRNWAPMRLNFFGWYLDAPRAVILVIFFLLGMVTAWLLEVRGKRAAHGVTDARAEEELEIAAELDEPLMEDVETGFDGAEEPAEEDAPLEVPPSEFEPAPTDFAPIEETGSDEDSFDTEDWEDDPDVARSEEDDDTTSVY
ncbi:MAG: LapA family protein [candidate division WS1 bacterium]|nr:LapA family protein [candidate division WS1 bacterium]